MRAARRQSPSMTDRDCAAAAHLSCLRVSCLSAAALVLDGRKCTSRWWAWASGWVLVALIAINYPFALSRGCGPASCRIGKALGSFARFWFSHHVLILVFMPLLVVHSIPMAPKGDEEGGELIASKAWLFLDDDIKCLSGCRYLASHTGCMHLSAHDC